MSQKMLSMAALCVLIGGGAIVLAEEVMPESSTVPAKVAEVKRTPEEILGDLRIVATQVQEHISGPEAFMDKQTRADTAPKVIPLLEKLLPLTDELSRSDVPRFQTIGKRLKLEMSRYLALFGNEQATQQLQMATTSDDPAEALSAKTAVLMNRWALSDQNETTQTKVVDDLEKLADASPASDELAEATMMLIQMGNVPDALKPRIDAILDTKLTGPTATAIKEQRSEGKKQKEAEGKPLVLAGKTHDGKEFSTEAWKGKVILVDFWATWCGPCIAELPRVKKLYAEYHDKGLEILGISCDQEAAELNAFLKENADMKWPQLFDAASPGWHPLAEKYGVKGIPTMFIIDRKGVLRSVTARAEMETLVPKLLAEKAE